MADTTNGRDLSDHNHVQIWGEHKKLSDNTIATLLALGFESMEALSLIEKEDLADANIPVGQVKLLLWAIQQTFPRDSEGDSSSRSTNLAIQTDQPTIRDPSHGTGIMPEYEQNLHDFVNQLQSSQNQNDGLVLGATGLNTPGFNWYLPENASSGILASGPWIRITDDTVACQLTLQGHTSSGKISDLFNLTSTFWTPTTDEALHHHVIQATSTENGFEVQLPVESYQPFLLSLELSSLPSSSARNDSVLTETQSNAWAIIDATTVDCLIVSYPAHALCTFDHDLHPLCGWRNDPRSDYFDWTRYKGSTPTTQTGPTRDHTFDSTKGHYMYIEVDGQSLKTALLESPVFPPPPYETSDELSTHYNTCQVRFAYHYFGSSVGLGRLVISILEPCSHDPSPSFRQIWRGSHLDNKDEWVSLAIPIHNVNKPFLIQVLATHNVNEHGDIAIDDISLSPQCFGIGITDEKYAESLLSLYDRNTWLSDVASKRRAFVDETIERQCQLTDTLAQEHKLWNRNLTSDDFQTSTSLSGSVVLETESGNSTKQKLPGFLFNSCGAQGRYGPTQLQCDAAYHHTDISVAVIQHGHLIGTQVWVVPQTAYYSITALGAKGGTGVKQLKPSYGGYVHGLFKLIQGERVHLVIGQLGQNACHQNSSICAHGLSDADDAKMLRMRSGGGGGGGATYVFKVDPETLDITSLMVAGGGGGMAYRSGDELFNANGGQNYRGTGKNGDSGMGPGGGGGIFDSTDFVQSGKSLVEGSAGGSPCDKAAWHVYGGFGGGGGACTSGGGGGGYEGGSASLMNNLFRNGQGGTSYIHPNATDASLAPGIHKDSGEAEILPHCRCEYRCTFINQTENLYYCSCPQDQHLDTDNHSCIFIVDPPPDVVQRTSFVDETSYPHSLHSGQIIGICAGVLMLFLFISSAITFCWYQKKQRHLRLVSQHQALFHPPNASHRPLFFQPPQSQCVEYNPHYLLTPDLLPVPRDKLQLLSTLGRGAFGEVFEGVLLKDCLEPRKISVAVKTLPAHSTEQAELDFLMEAMIMSKFDHPNIVKFVGVCFETHPRYIVLELLAGRDLKTFLRESRSTSTCVSDLTVKDLLRLSIDVCHGCHYLEENHFIHRDIAARNCLLSSKDVVSVAKIADFGMSRDIYRADYYKKGGKAVLPVKWMPPEAFLDGIFTSKTDVWSFGILLWEVFSMGLMPYPWLGNYDVMEFVTMGGRMEGPDLCAPQICAIMTDCWNAIPGRRPDFSSVLERLTDCFQDADVLSRMLPVFDNFLVSGDRGSSACAEKQESSDPRVVALPRTSSYCDGIAKDLDSPQSPNKHIPYANTSMPSSREPLLPHHHQSLSLTQSLSSHSQSVSSIQSLPIPHSQSQSSTQSVPMSHDQSNTSTHSVHSTHSLLPSLAQPNQSQTSMRLTFSPSSQSDDSMKGTSDIEMSVFCASNEECDDEMETENCNNTDQEDDNTGHEISKSKIASQNGYSLIPNCDLDTDSDLNKVISSKSDCDD